MKVEKVEGKEERQILIGMVTNNQVLGRIAAKYEGEMFLSRWSNLIAEWCLKFFEKYKKAPKKSIENQFEKWAKKNRDKETIQLVEKFLGSLSDEYDTLDKEINADHLIDRAGEHFNKVKMTKLKEQLEETLESGDIDKAESALDTYRRIEMGDEEFVDPYFDKEAHKYALQSRQEPLFKLPGSIGSFFGRQLSRENFLAIFGPEKGGKSFWLQELCHLGARERLRCAFFGIGDMSKDQTLSRYQARLCRRPIEAEVYHYPVVWNEPKNGETLPKRKKRKTEDRITMAEIERAREKFVRHNLRTKKKKFRLLCKPTMSLSDIRSKLFRWNDLEQWTPDILAVDYADLLERPRGIKDKLEAIDENWRQLRNLALELHCLVLTASQIKRTAYRKRWMDLGDTADQKTKAAHATGIIGINFSQEEYKHEVRRLNWVALRESTPRSTVTVAGCFAIANPCVLSC